ncbi:TonB-dependent receptor family protein [Rhizobacter sp. P5_C2]
MNHRIPFSALTLAVLTALSPPALAQQVLPTVTVTATRTETPRFDVPASIDVVDGDRLRDGRLQVNLSDGLAGVPGLQARDRQNYAQDVQISVRGFGARSTFGIRGVRLYVDGIPATLPDGQGQISNVDLNSVERIEVLRGPFSALYGNSSGGVLQIFTEEGEGRPALSFGVAAGSDGAWRTSSKLSGSEGRLSYLLSTSHFETDGYRDHSAARRDLGNAKLVWRADEDTRWSVVLNSVALPFAQDPLGLTRAAFDADPRSADAAATDFDTRKTVSQTQAGIVLDRRLPAGNALRVMVYGGHRRTEQFQSIPVATQANPLHPGGVIDLRRDYSGTDWRWTTKTTIADRPLTLIGGVAYDRLRELRQGYLDFTGAPATPQRGQRGSLRRDETNFANNLDPYVQASWQPAADWTLNAGVRHSRVRFESHDNYIVGANPDDSGSADYSATLPVLGVLWAASPSLHLYATAGKGFETPTLNELGYRPNGATGLNFTLQPATSRSLELGVKARLDGIGEVNAAVFQTRTSDEIVTLTNTGGRSTFQNAGSTRRTGLELSAVAALPEPWKAQAAATWLDARYRDAFMTCTATPCATPNVAIASDQRIPGIARSSFQASLAWAPPQGWRAGVEVRALSKVFVNDLNSDAAAGQATVGASVGHVLLIGSWRLDTFVRGDNLFDRSYAGSVIVNEGNARYFEPAPGRNWVGGITGRYAF